MDLFKYTRRIARVSVLAMILLSSPRAAPLDSLWSPLYRSFDFLPEYYLQVDISMFGLQKNDYFRERYFVESNASVDFVFLSFKDIVYSVWDVDLQLGLGQTPGNLVFDPMDIVFHTTPSIETKLKPVSLICGLEHQCFHEIDRKDFKTVYWNRLLVAAASPNRQLFDYWAALVEDEGWTQKNRFSWYVEWGYFLREFFGLAAPSKLNGENDRVHEGRTTVRYAVYRRRSWFFTLKGQTKAGLWDEEGGDRKAYWFQTFGIEACFRRGHRGAMFFVDYMLDDIPMYHGAPRFSHDRLVQAGVRWFS